MGVKRVKPKVVTGIGLTLVVLALASFALSWGGLIPATIVETWYSRWIYPVVSGILIAGAGLVGISWLDVLLPATLVTVVWLLYRRKLIPALAVTSIAYLLFFWGWGLNYHRVALDTKVDFEPERVTEASVRALVEHTARSLNRLYVPSEDRDWGRVPGEDGLVAEADSEIRRIIAVIDEIPERAWNPRTRVKASFVLDPFFRAAGIDGMFNPFGHEPILTSDLLAFERPMAILHELAHVRGYPDEGDANFVALLAGVHSSDRRLQYSAWLSLWMYLRPREGDGLLDAGPREDLEAAYRRMESGRIEWVDRAQSHALDSFLRANRVEGGVRSYTRIVELAAGTRDSWERFE